MTEKKHGGRLHKTDRKKMLQKPKNTGMADKFPPESPEKSGKIMDMERKISHTARKKA